MYCRKFTQESERARLTRRQVLKMIGGGISILTFSGIAGCTSSWITAPNGITSRSGSAMVTDFRSFHRTQKAKQKLNRKYLNSLFKGLRHNLKQASRELQRQDRSANPGTVLQRIQDSLEFSTRIINHFEDVGVLEAADQDWVEILTISPNAIQVPTPRMKRRVRKLSQQIGLPDLSSDQMLSEITWDNRALLAAIRDRGLKELWDLQFLYVRKRLEELPTNETQYFISPLEEGFVQAQQWWVWLLRVLGSAALTVLTHEECANCNEQPPEEGTPPGGGLGSCADPEVSCPT